MNLDLVKRVVQEPIAEKHFITDPIKSFEEVKDRLIENNFHMLDNHVIKRIFQEDLGLHLLNSVWKTSASNTFSMHDNNYIDALLELIDQTKEIHGDVIEAGCWRGGISAVLRAYLLETNQHKTVYAADSFCGLPTDGKPRKQRDYRGVLIIAKSHF